MDAVSVDSTTRHVHITLRKDDIVTVPLLDDLRHQFKTDFAVDNTDIGHNHAVCVVKNEEIFFIIVGDVVCSE